MKGILVCLATSLFCWSASAGIQQKAIDAFNNDPQVRKLIAEKRKMGFKAERIGAALFSLAWGDEGFDSDYLVTLPMVKRTNPPLDVESELIMAHVLISALEKRVVVLDSGQLSDALTPIIER